MGGKQNPSQKGFYGVIFAWVLFQNNVKWAINTEDLVLTILVIGQNLCEVLHKLIRTKDFINDCNYFELWRFLAAKNVVNFIYVKTDNFNKNK